MSNKLTKKECEKKAKISCERLGKLLIRQGVKFYNIEEKDLEINLSKVLSVTQAISVYGAQPNSFTGLITLTVGKNKNDRIKNNDDDATIIVKTKRMYNSILFFIKELKKTLEKNGFDIIYIVAFELQEDGNLHAHIYFSLSLEAFSLLFDFYHDFYKKYPKSQKIKLNNKNVEIIPIGRAQLGISNVFKTKLEQKGFIFEKHYNKKSKRYEYSCTGKVTINEFLSGAWPTLFFYDRKNLEKIYGEKIVKYLTKQYKITTRQKAIGSHFIKHNTKNLLSLHNINLDNETDNDTWNKICSSCEAYAEIQKKFIRYVCKKIYISSRLPIQVKSYQKYRKQIIKAYPRYKYLNNLVEDLMNKKAYYNKKRGTLICPNGEKLILK